MRPVRKIPESYVRIWNTVLRIPRGRVATYGTVARLAGFDSHARLVGYALHALPDGSTVPWHRVINAQGRISLRKVRGADVRQQKMLGLEGIRLRNGKIDLERFAWPERSSSIGAVMVRGGKRTRTRRA